MVAILGMLAEFVPNMTFMLYLPPDNSRRAVLQKRVCMSRHGLRPVSFSESTISGHQKTTRSLARVRVDTTPGADLAACRARSEACVLE